MTAERAIKTALAFGILNGRTPPTSAATATEVAYRSVGGQRDPRIAPNRCVWKVTVDATYNSPGEGVPSVPPVTVARPKSYSVIFDVNSGFMCEILPARTATKTFGGISARVVLPSTSMTTGTSMSGHVVVQNNTGHALHPSGCGSLFSVFLSNASTPHPLFDSCLEVFTIPVGPSSYPVTVDATYLECAGPLGNGRPCVERNGHAVMPPLPPGEYRASLWGDVVPKPPPIAVQVTPARSNP